MSDISILKIRTDGGTQPRSQLNWLVIDEYSDAMKDGVQFPAVTVFYDGSDYWLADGFHRVNAAQQAGLDTINADIRQGTRRDAILYSVGANAGHGLRRTNEDKRRAVMALLNDDEWKQWSDREIARRCNVTHPFVSVLRSSLVTVTSETQERTYTTKHGTVATMNTAKIGAAPTAQIPLDVRTVVRNMPIADNPTELATLARLDAEIQEQVLEIIASGDAKGVTEARREIKERKREERRQENAVKAASTPSPLEVGAKFATILIDPPWDWGDEGDVNQMGRAKPDYGTMRIDELERLPVADLADDDCHLYLWITNRSLPKGFRLLEAWGFRYVTCVTWAKPHFGMGNYFRGQTEHLLFGVKGSQMLKRRDVGTICYASRGDGGHSSKPNEAYELIESCSPGPYLEMFSRRSRLGWSMWGADAE